MIIRPVLFFALVALALAASDSDDACDRTTMECSSPYEIAQMIRHLKTENRRLFLKSALENENCTICWSSPCLNNGICISLSPSQYRCECPDDYSGPNCDKHIECKANSCGKNAKCYVGNHQLHCVCLPGYIGNPHRGCSLHTVQSCMTGDPHYRTFDNQRYEYQGTCPYVFSQPCNATAFASSGLSYFSVRAKNELSYKGASVSTVGEVDVEMHGVTFHVGKARHNLYVNGVRKAMPYSWPNNFNWQVKVTFASGTVTITSDEMVKVTVSVGRLCVSVPDTDEYKGSDTLCGLAGNRDEKCTDDFRNRDGTVVSPIRSCSNHFEPFTEVFGDTWIEKDHFFGFDPEKDTCVNGVTVANTTMHCDKEQVAVLCKPILDAAEGRGIFGKCEELGKDAIQDAYDECFFDTCTEGALRCTALATFVRHCQLNVPGTPLDWRSDQKCPPLHCALHATASSCAAACPRTCSDPDEQSDCSESCTEGCQCDDGYVLDLSSSKGPQCKPPQECGCKDKEGNMHASDETWLTKNCTVYNYCSNSTYHYRSQKCSDNGSCVVRHGSYMCACEDGFVGDGYNCKDFDECSDKSKCGADQGHGVCVNKPGTYECVCNHYYMGLHCEYFKPKRHCADLYKHHNKRSSGVYQIEPPYPVAGRAAFTPTKVFCEMESYGGGWTLMADSTSTSTSNRTFADYELGFGDLARRDVWLGLQFIHGMTNEVSTSLHLQLHRCARNHKPATATYCTYPRFSTLSEKEAYAVIIPEECSGTEQQYYDGWARWDLNAIGPAFVAFDTDKSRAKCSASYRNTGWWFDTSVRCGSANLNGNRYSCATPPPSEKISHYLQWAGNPLDQASLWLRPMAFPNYDKSA